MNTNVLVIEDEEDVRSLVRRVLERAGFGVDEAADGRVGMRRLFEGRPDLVVLDVGLPELDGWAVLERIRDVSDVPVVMLTARAGEMDRVRGLRAGADDYVTKPFLQQELLARVEAVLRRAQPARALDERYSDGVLEIDYAAHGVTFEGREVALSPLEFRLLDVLVRHRDQVLSHEQLLELVWSGSRGRSESQVKLYIGYLRRKLRADGGSTPIETVRGFGYRYRSQRRAPTQPAS